MNKLLSCHYNMDTNRVEARFEDGTMPLPSTALPSRTSTATPRHSGQNWTGCCTISRWSMRSLCWVGKIEHYLSLSCDHGRLEEQPDIDSNTAPLW